MLACIGKICKQMRTYFHKIHCMADGKRLLMEDFGKKSFSEKKQVLLEMLSKLYGTSQMITDLGNLVHGLRDETKNYMLMEVYDILLDAVYATQADELNESVDKLEQARQVLLDMKEREEAELAEERNSQDIEEILRNL